MAENTIVVGHETQMSDEVASTEKQDARFVTKGENTTDQRTPMDRIIETMSKAVATLARSSKTTTVEAACKSVLVTIAAMNNVDEFTVGLQVSGFMYRFNEYEAPAGVRELVNASRVVLTDTMSAKNFYKREAFKTTIARALTPGEFIASVRLICSNIRTNPTLSPVDKARVELIADSNKYAVNSGRVEDRAQPRITYLTTAFDSDKAVPINDWIQTRAMTLFS